MASWISRDDVAKNNDIGAETVSVIIQRSQVRGSRI